jgi:hypothetical protein
MQSSRRSRPGFCAAPRISPSPQRALLGAETAHLRRATSHGRCGRRSGLQVASNTKPAACQDRDPAGSNTRLPVGCADPAGRPHGEEPAAPWPGYDQQTVPAMPSASTTLVKTSLAQSGHTSSSTNTARVSSTPPSRRGRMADIPSSTIIHGAQLSSVSGHAREGAHESLLWIQLLGSPSSIAVRCRTRSIGFRTWAELRRASR